MGVLLQELAPHSAPIPHDTETSQSPMDNDEAISPQEAKKMIDIITSQVDLENEYHYDSPHILLQGFVQSLLDGEEYKHHEFAECMEAALDKAQDNEDEELSALVHSLLGIGQQDSGHRLQ